MLAVLSSEERCQNMPGRGGGGLWGGWKSVLASRESTEYAPPHAYPPSCHAPYPLCLIPYYSLTMCFLTTWAVKVDFKRLSPFLLLCPSYNVMLLFEGVLGCCYLEVSTQLGRLQWSAVRQHLTKVLVRALQTLNSHHGHLAHTWLQPPSTLWQFAKTLFCIWFFLDLQTSATWPTVCVYL